MRQIPDALLKASKALPAAAGTSYTDALYMGEGEPLEAMEILISAEAAPALADDKDATYALQESADGENFVAAPWAPAPVITQTGAGGNGAAAAEQRLRPPSTAKPYLRLKQDVEAAGGDNTAKSGTIEFLF